MSSTHDEILAAGVPDSAHSLRQAGATLAAEGGTERSAAQWADGSQSARYIGAANREKLAAGWNISVPPKGAGTKRLEMTSEINVEEAGWWALESWNLQPDGYEPSGNGLS